MPFTGQCRCGQLKLHLHSETLGPLYACHCLNCQRWSGSAFGLHLLCAASAVTLSGQAQTWVHEHEGQTSTQYACGTCFTRVFNETTAAPGMRVVRAAVLDDAEQRSPVAHIWTRRKQPWVVLPETVAQWPQSPTPEEFARVVMGSLG